MDAGRNQKGGLLENVKLVKGWFKIPGVQDGDRTLQDQITGLNKLVEEVKDKSILDLGCAEGLISKYLLENRAYFVEGIEMVSRSVNVAIAENEGLNARFHQGNLNDIGLCFSKLSLFNYDIVLCLSILHKLKMPGAALKHICEKCIDLMVIRLPKRVLIDHRSNNVPYDIPALMHIEGFNLESETIGPFNEWTGYFRRRV
jgi:SAM-dependent methyltransferase